MIVLSVEQPLGHAIVHHGLRAFAHPERTMMPRSLWGQWAALHIRTLHRRVTTKVRYAEMMDEVGWLIDSGVPWPTNALGPIISWPELTAEAAHLVALVRFAGSEVRMERPRPRARKEARVVWRFDEMHPIPKVKVDGLSPSEIQWSRKQHEGLPTYGCLWHLPPRYARRVRSQMLRAALGMPVAA